jgi:hypothetical protein
MQHQWYTTFEQLSGAVSLKLEELSILSNYDLTPDKKQQIRQPNFSWLLEK